MDAREELKRWIAIIKITGGASGDNAKLAIGIMAIAVRS